MTTDQYGCARALAVSITVIVAMTTALSWAQLTDHDQPLCMCIGFSAQSITLSCRIVDDPSAALLMLAKNTTMGKFITVEPMDHCKQDRSLF